MVGTIRPVVGGHQTRGWARRVAFLVAASLGGAGGFWIFAVLTSGMMSGTSAGVSGVAAGAGVVALLTQLGILIARPIGFHRQVRQQWGSSPFNIITPIAWGLELGFGLSTHIPTWGYWLALLMAVELGPLPALMLGTIFGMIRGIEPMVIQGDYRRFAQTLRHLRKRYQELRLPAAAATVAASVGIVGFIQSFPLMEASPWL